MVDRYRVWLGAGVLAGGVSTAMLAGAGVAVADDGSSSTSGTQRSSGSGDSDGAGAGPEAKAKADRPSQTTRATDSEAGSGRASEPDADDGTDADASPDLEDSKPEADVDEESAASPDVTDDQAEAPVDQAEAPVDQAEAPVDQSEPGSAAGGKHRAPGTDEPASGAVSGDIVDPPAAEPMAPQQLPGNADVTDTAVVGTDTSELPSTLLSSIETDITSAAGTAVMNAAAQSVPAFAQPPSALVDFFNSVGSMVYNFYTRTMQFIAGPARAPFGSSVRVERSALTLGNGVVVPADWYFPDNDEPPAGLVYFQHGFLATASFYNATAAYLAEKTNSIVVAPTLTWNIFDTENYPLMLPHTHRAIADLFVGDRSALDASARTAGFAGTLPSRVVLAGHSAGGGLVTGTARHLVERGVADDLAGVLMFDGASYLDLMSLDVAEIPHSIPVYNLAAEPDSWNMYGDTTIRLAQARPGMFTGVLVGGGRHADSMQSTSPLIQFMSYLATGSSSPLNVAANEILGAGWINDMFAGTHTAMLYGVPGATLDLLDGWWRHRLAHVLPLASVDLRVFDQASACLLNPAALYCNDLPWRQAAHWFAPMIPNRSATWVA